MNKVQLQNRTKSFAIRVFKMVEKLPKSKGTEVITYQLMKASSSVAADYRAVCRAKSKADFINKLKIVEEESDESLFWLEFIADLEIIHKKLLKDLIKEANELVSIFTVALKTSKTNYKSQISNRTRPAKPFASPTCLSGGDGNLKYSECNLPMHRESNMSLINYK